MDLFWYLIWVDGCYVCGICIICCFVDVYCAKPGDSICKDVVFSFYVDKCDVILLKQHHPSVQFCYLHASGEKWFKWFMIALESTFCTSKIIVKTLHTLQYGIGFFFCCAPILVLHCEGAWKVSNWPNILFTINRLAKNAQVCIVRGICVQYVWFIRIQKL